MNTQNRSFLFAAIILVALYGQKAGAAVGSYRGDEPGYWKDCSVVIGKVVEIIKSKEYMGTRIRLSTLGTVSGFFDCGEQREIAPRVQTGSGDDVVILNPPRLGAVVVVVITDPRKSALPADRALGLYIENSFARYMPAPRANLAEVNGLTDPKIDKILSSIREVRKKSKESPSAEREKPADGTFWSAHSLVYGKIEGQKSNGDNPRSATIDFRPSLRLSGELDPGLVDKLDARVDLKALRVPLREIPASGNALVLLVRDGDSYAVAPERADFMPSDHSPICVVKDFSDPQVSDTLKAVQELRKKEKPAEKTEK